MTPDDADGVAVSDLERSAQEQRERRLVSYDDAPMQRDDPDQRLPDHHAEHTPDRSGRLYVGLWLPAAGALIAYAVMHKNYWAAFIGIELLLVGWFTLGKL